MEPLDLDQCSLPWVYDFVLVPALHPRCSSVNQDIQGVFWWGRGGLFCFLKALQLSSKARKISTLMRLCPTKAHYFLTLPPFQGRWHREEENKSKSQ